MRPLASALLLLALLGPALAAEDGKLVCTSARRPAAPRTVTGSVTDPLGAPLAEVQVWRLTGPGAPHRLAVTGADGRFVLPGLTANDHLELCRPGFLTGGLGVAAAGETVQVVLTPAARVAGRVLDAAGNPLADATVRGLHLADTGMRCMEPTETPCAHDRTLRSAQTGADGRYLIDHFEPGLYRLHAEAPGYLASPPLHLELPAGERRAADIHLNRGAVLRGRVLDAGGAPLRDIRLFVFSGRSHRNDVTTGADGAFLLSGLEPGPVTVGLYTPQNEYRDLTVEVRAGENLADLRWEAQATSELRGRVVDGAGRPVAGAQVTQEGLPYDTSSVETGADGAFALPAKDGLHELWAEAPGYAPTPRSRPVRIRGATVEGLELRLEPATVLRGRVTGAPAAVGHVSVRRDGVLRTAEAEARGGLRLDPDGRFTVPDLGPGVWRVHANGRGFEAVGEVRIEPGESEVTLGLEPLAIHRIEGRVLGPDGAPVARAGVWARQREELVAHGSDETSADGSFSLRLRSGSYLLSASAPGLGGVTAAEPLEVGDGSVSGLELRLRGAAPLTGRIVGLEAAELLNVEVVARQGEIERYARLDPDAEFALPDLGPGPWMVTARLGSRAARTRVVLADLGAAEPVEIAFSPRRLSLSGRVTEGEAVVPRDVELWLEGDRRPLATAAADPAGGFRLADLAPGRYRLVVRDRRAERVLHETEIALTRDRTLTIALPAPH